MADMYDSQKQGHGGNGSENFHANPTDKYLSDVEQRNFVSNYCGKVYTAINGPFRVGEMAHGVLALLENGQLMVSKTESMHTSIPDIRHRAHQQRVMIREVLYVDASTLREMYKRFAQRASRADEGFMRSSEAERLLTKILADATRYRASDIHIAVEQVETIVKFRVDGQIELNHKYSREMGNYLIHSAYALSDESSGAMLNEQVPESSRITGLKFTLPQGVQALRLQFLPKASSSHLLAVRVLYGNSLKGRSDIEHLGFAHYQSVLIARMKNLPHGMNVIAGATNSGKSTTLQRVLEGMLRDNNNAKNIVTIEDPPEYRIEGAHQVPVMGQGQRRAEGFTLTIDAALRADPDVLMIGEVRDKESAMLACKATITGHQVWSTVHAFSATRALDRFIAEGVPSYRILDAGVVTGLIGQRLIPVVCPVCAMDWEGGKRSGRFDTSPGFDVRFEGMFSGLAHEVLHHWIRVRNPAGCPGDTACRNGYRGRTLVAEVIFVDNEFIAAYEEGRVRAAERHWIEEMGGVYKHEHGFMQMLGGRIDPLDLENEVTMGTLNTDPKRREFLHALALREGLIASEVRLAGLG